jgi:hypothetical protein
MADFQKALKRSQQLPGRYTWFARVPFGVFAVGGMLGICAAKFYGIPQLYVTGGAVVLILLYFAVVAWFPVLKIREDQLGDNCYYLGFLYTLASLSWALFRFTIVVDAPEPIDGAASDGIGSQSTQEITDIVANFGIALASTIVGILLRVIINQARKDVLETERDARMLLTEAMVNMRVQLDDAVIAMKAFCDQTRQITADAIRENAERANTALDQSVAKVGETSSSVLRSIEEAFEEFSGNTKKLNQIAAGTVKALEGLIKRLEAMEPPSDLISKRLDIVMESAEKAGGLLRERLEADEQAITAAAKRMAEIEEQLKIVAGSMSTIGNGLSGVPESAAKAARAAEDAAGKLADLTSVMSHSLAQQDHLMTETQAASAKLHSGLIEEQKRLAVEAKAGLDALVDALKAHNNAMTEEVDRARRMTTATGQALADLANSVTDQVRDLRGAAAQ